MSLFTNGHVVLEWGFGLTAIGVYPVLLGVPTLPSGWVTERVPHFVS